MYFATHLTFLKSHMSGTIEESSLSMSLLGTIICSPHATIIVKLHETREPKSVLIHIYPINIKHKTASSLT